MRRMQLFDMKIYFGVMEMYFKYPSTILCRIYVGEYISFLYILTYILHIRVVRSQLSLGASCHNGSIEKRIH